MVGFGAKPGEVLKLEDTVLDGTAAGDNVAVVFALLDSSLSNSEFGETGEV